MKLICLTCSVGEPDQNARLQERWRCRRRQVRIRTVALAVLLALAAGIALGARAVGSGHSGAPRQPQRRAVAPKPAGRAVPDEIRGVHVTMALASPGRLQQYLSIPGLNAIELDVKDEDGHIGPGIYYDAKRAVRDVHSHGDYLIGRVVTFEDPVLSEKRPELAIRSSDGSVWHTSAGLGWTNPYDRRVWAYNVNVAAAAAKAGFDEIQFDYVRFPSDGDVSLMRIRARIHSRCAGRFRPSSSTPRTGCTGLV
jgi:Putative glycosyl hydrolase domain